MISSPLDVNCKDFYPECVLKIFGGVMLSLRTIIFTSLLTVLFTGCSGDSSDGDKPAPSPSELIPIVMNELGFINTLNEDSFELGGTCTFSGEASLRFFQEVAAEEVDAGDPASPPGDVARYGRCTCGRHWGYARR